MILMGTGVRFIYTGKVEMTTDIAQDLLKATDQYILEGLKCLCEYSIALNIYTKLFHTDPWTIFS